MISCIIGFCFTIVGLRDFFIGNEQLGVEYMTLAAVWYLIAKGEANEQK